MLRRNFDFAFADFELSVSNLRPKKMRQFCKIQRLAALIVTFLACVRPICALAQQFEPVDEPVGARYSLGLTLWHMGHNPGYIERFHRFLAQRGQSPQSLLQPLS